jgi:hypothetical protein
MQQVIQEAFDKVANSRRWQMAIARAKGELESNPYMHWNGVALVVLSSSNEIYEANGTCQCKAYRHGQPCWHRAAARLVERYMEAVPPPPCLDGDLLGRGCCFMCDDPIAADGACACVPRTRSN